MNPEVQSLTYAHALNMLKQNIVQFTTESGLEQSKV